ncbi:MAG: MFS transporter [Lactobacillales bacterium]|jgi:MFS family permease|nr:MFS transporter [Lactobacillales bacterium]
MKSKIRTIVVGILTIIFAALTIYTYQMFHLIGVESEFYLENINRIASSTKDDAVIVIDSGKQKIVKRTRTGQLDYLIEKQGKRGFQQAEEIAVKDEHEIYVLDTVLNEDGIHVEQQRILKYRDGKFVEEVFDYAYPSKKQERFDGKFQTLSYEKGRLYLIEREKNSFLLHSIDENEKKLKKERRYSFENADYLLHSFAYRDGKMFAVSKMGQIFRCLENNYESFYLPEEHLVKGQKNKEMSFPWEMKIDKDGSLYATDIGLRSVIKISPSKEIQFFKSKIARKENFLKQSLYYQLDVLHNEEIFVCGENALEKLDLSSRETRNFNKIEISKFQHWRSLGFFVAFVGLIISVLTLLYPFIKKIFFYFLTNPSMRVEISLFSFVAITAFFVSSMVIGNYNKRYEQELLDRISSTGMLVGEILDKDSIQKINSPVSFDTKDYQKIHEQLMRIIENEDAWDDPLYIDLYKVNNGVITTFANTSKQSVSYYPWNWVYDGSIEQKIFKTKKGVRYSGFQSNEGRHLFSLEPIFDEYDGKHKKVVALIEVGMNMDEFDRQNRKMVLKIILNTLSLIVVMMLLVRELITFLDLYRKWKERKQKEPEKPFISGNITRPLMFVIFFASNLSASFMPTYAASIYTPFLGISKDLASALPMTFEIIFIALGFVGGMLSERFGIKKMLNFSFIIFALGLLGCGLAQNVWQLTVGNSISGFGSGLGLVIINTYIGLLSSEKERKFGFASMGAATLSGINSAVLIGSGLGGLIGNRNVFYIGGMLGMLILLYIHGFVDSISVCKSRKEDTTKMNLISFLFKPQVFIYLIGVLIPYFASTYFVYYFFPIFGDKNGLSEVEIGQAFLLNGVWIVFLGPIISNIVLEKLGKVKAILMGFTLYILSFIAFGFKQTLLVALIVLVVMGISDSFSFTAQNVYFTSLKEVDHYGVNRSMGLYSLFDSLGQAVGPLLFSFVLSIGIFRGMTLLVGMLIVAVILFTLSNIRKRRFRK